MNDEKGYGNLKVNHEYQGRVLNAHEHAIKLLRIWTLNMYDVCMYVYVYNKSGFLEVHDFEN